MRENKSNFILKSIIKAYLREQMPIGSMLLQQTLNVPASTIRVYFKQLDEQGFVCKAHASSGRMPTITAMKAHWKEQIIKLSKYKLRVLNDLEFFKLIDELELFCLVIDERTNVLSDVINIKNSHLLLDFTDFAVVLPYGQSEESLFNELMGCDERGILRVLDRLNLHHLKGKIADVLSQQKVFSHGMRRFYTMNSNFSADEFISACLRSDNGFINENFLEQEFLGFKLSCCYHNIPASLVVCGSVYKNYERLLSTLKEAV